MTTNSINEDLAYLRSLTEGGSEANYRGLAETYCWAGLVYGTEMFLHAMQMFGFLPRTNIVSLALGLGPSIIFVAGLAVIIARNPKTSSNFTARSVGAVFAAVGIGGLGLMAVVGAVALRERSLATWLIYPCAIFILQGAAWLVSFGLRRRLWHGAVGAGWFVTGIGMAVSIAYMPGFVLFASIGFIFCMALPGFLLLRVQAA